MIKLARRATLHLWIALLAILFSALAPTLSQALAAADPLRALQLCTVQPVYAAAAADVGTSTSSGSDKAPPGAAHGAQHCAFCTIHGGGDALPPPAIALAISAGRDIHPPLFYQAPRALPVWLAANPRAPPVLA